MATVAGILAILGLLLWPSNGSRTMEPTGSGVLGNGAARQAPADDEASAERGAVQVVQMGETDAVAPSDPSKPLGLRGAATCADPRDDTTSASGTFPERIPEWVDVRRVTIDVSPAITAVTWQFADAPPDTIYSEGDAFAWSLWTTVVTGEQTDLQLIIRLDATTWTAFANDLATRTHGIPGRVDLVGDQLMATFETAALGPLDRTS